MAQGPVHQSRRRLLLGPGGGAAHVGSEEAGRNRQYCIRARTCRRQRRRGLCCLQGRRGAGHQGTGGRARVQGRACQRYRARLVCYRNERRLPDERSRCGAQARDPDGPLRQSRRSRRGTAVARVGRRQLHHRGHNRCGRRASHPDQGLEGRRMDFTLAPEIEDIRLRVRAFVEEYVLPLEADPENFSEHENIPEARLAKVRERAKKAGLWAPQSPKEFGGMELPIVAWPAIYEEAARSIFGPLAINCMAPDDGNMNLLSKVGTPEQKEKWLRPIVEGKVRSSFVMTEPHPGSGSDPAMMLSRAEKRNDRYIVRGRKWFITGADGASHFILVARTSDDSRRGLTAFLYHKDQPGWRILRRIPIMGPEEHGGHCELEFDGLEIPLENVLMNEGDGLRATQIRLGPARLTHCMRWLGFAKRCMEIAQEYVGRREGFGMKLADRESVQIKLGEIAQQIQIGRLLTMHAAWKLEQGSRARKEVSMAKVQVADALHNAADVAIQLNGARGYSKDTILEWIYRAARSARLVDGATEVHMMVLARFLREQGGDFWQWGPGEGRRNER